MLRVIAIVYLFSLANGLLWVALDPTFGPAGEPVGTPAEAPETDIAGSDALFAHVSLLVAAVAMALQAGLQRWIHAH
jgi:hypothetical protein